MADTESRVNMALEIDVRYPQQMQKMDEELNCTVCSPRATTSRALKVI